MHRRIHRLRLSCSHEDHARHGRVLLEDAMRTATFNDEGRLIVVRKLDLGCIPLRGSATHWSRRLEESYQTSRPTLVSFDHPAADRANAVSFANVFEPWLILAQRTVANQPCQEWFWPQVLPGWVRGQTSPQTLRLCLRSLAAEGGLIATVLLALRLEALHALSHLLQSVRPEDLAALQRELGTFLAGPVRDAERSMDGESRFSPLGADEAGYIRTWGVHDPRTLWLAVVHLVRDTPIGPASLTPVSLAPALVRQLLRYWTDSSASIPAAAPAETAPARSPASRARKNPIASHANESPRAAVNWPERLSPRAVSPDGPERLFTRGGGLFFAVPLLGRAALPAFLAALPAHKAAALPWQILKLALMHSRIDEDDPLYATVQALPAGGQNLGRWLLAANRQALRLARMNLRQLIVRPALVTVSPTHIDLFFRPTEADIRIRRVGLDLDPGWVPWLGRAIAYHFNRD